MHTFEVQIDPEMMKRAWNAWFFRGRRMGRLGVACFLLLAAIFGDARDGSYSAMSVVSGTILGFSFLIYFAIYIVGVRRALNKLESIVDGKATYILTEDSITAGSSLGSYTLAWKGISEVRCFRTFLLVIFLGGSYSTIPAAQIPEQALAFLLERVKAAGGKITRL